MNAQHRLIELEAELADRGAGPTQPPQTPARARLEAARAERDRLAALGNAEPADTSTAPTVEPGTLVHCLDDRGVVVPRSTVIYGEPGITIFRGDELTITAEMLEAAKDKFGNPGGIAFAADEAEQVRRWGRVRLRVGPAPAGLERWIHGSPDWVAAREQARQAAWRETDPERRAAALQAVKDRFGAAPVTSTTLNESPDPSIRLAEEQRARLDSGGVRFSQHVEAKEAGAGRCPARPRICLMRSAIARQSCSSRCSPELTMPGLARSVRA